MIMRNSDILIILKESPLPTQSGVKRVKITFGTLKYVLLFIYTENKIANKIAII